MGSLTLEENNGFSEGRLDSTINLSLDSNLYWNGGQPIPGGDLLSPLKDDRHPLVADPQLGKDFDGLILPVWDGSQFRSGNLLIRDEFLRLAHEYGSLAQRSPALRKGNLECAPGDDIFRFLRDVLPSFGADQGTPWITSLRSPFSLSTTNNPQ
jgi:hypothetical protein